MAENALTGVDTSSYPRFQPIQQQNPLAQVQAAQGLALQQQQMQGQQFELGKQRLGYIQDQLGALITKPDLSFSDASQVVSNLVANKIIPPDQTPQILSQLSQDPTQLRAQIKQYYLTNLDHTNRFHAAFGQQTVYDNGVARQYGVTNPMNPGQPQFRGGTVQPNYEPMNVPNANTGATDVTTRAGFGQNVGALNGAITRRGQQPTAQPNAGQPSAPASGGQGSIPGINPQLASDREAYNTDLNTSKNLMTSIQPLKQALPLAERLANSPVGTGPGTKTENDVRTFLIAQKFIKPDENVDIRHELDKYLAQTVAGSPLSNRSDMGTLVAQASNPNTVTQTTPATIALIRNAIGQANLQAATPLAFQGKTDTSGNMSPAGYQPHRAAFTQQQDVEAYKLDTMDPQAARALVQKYAGMDRSDPRRTRFFQSLTNADKAKVVNAPGQ